MSIEAAEFFFKFFALTSIFNITLSALWVEIELERSTEWTLAFEYTKLNKFGSNGVRIFWMPYVTEGD